LVYIVYFDYKWKEVPLLALIIFFVLNTLLSREFYPFELIPMGISVISAVMFIKAIKYRELGFFQMFGLGDLIFLAITTLFYGLDFNIRMLFVSLILVFIYYNKELFKRGRLLKLPLLTFLGVAYYIVLISALYFPLYRFV